MTSPTPTLQLQPNDLPPSREGEPSWLYSTRKLAIAKVNKQGLPTKKLEHWKYTTLIAGTSKHLIPTTNNDASSSTITYEKLNDHAPNILQLSELGKFPTLQAKIGKTIEQLLCDPNQFNQQSMVALNHAFVADITIIYIAPSLNITQPIEITHHAVNKTSYHQTILILDQGSSATLIERFETQANNQDNQENHHNHVNHIILNAHASLTHYRLQRQALTDQHIYNTHATLLENSHYHHVSFNSGSKLMHQSMYLTLQGQHCKSDVRGISLVKETQHHDIYLPITHQCAHAYSNQHFRNILKDNATHVFYGGVYAGKDCPKTEAHQLCKTVLLDDKATAFLRPELDILTDDVICSHGATVGNLDPEALLYLTTRGLDTTLAYQLLLQGFVNELVETIAHDDVKSDIQTSIERWGGMIA